MRDLAVNPVPHLDAQPVGRLDEAGRAAWRWMSDIPGALNHLTDELLAADVLVMAAPMYNFAISTLKAWLGHVLRAGVTFKYTATGPQGLLTGKRAFVLTARGGIHTGASSVIRNRICARSWVLSGSMM